MRGRSAGALPSKREEELPAEASLMDGVLQLDSVAEHLVHEIFQCDTRDHEVTPPTLCLLRNIRSVALLLPMPVGPYLLRCDV